jgi:predicted homoserine dehydrogenase-like protein
MRKLVLKGETITWDAVELDETSNMVKLRRQQDALPTIDTTLNNEEA